MTHKKLSKQRAQIRLATNRQNLSAREATCRKLGGVTVWAETVSDLDFGLRSLSDAISLCAAPHLSITKSVLRKLVRDHLAESNIADRLFSAVLGATLRQGVLDAMVCGSENDRPYRILIHSSQIQHMTQALDTAETMLRRESILDVPRLEKVIFGRRSYNTWSSTSHLLARLSYLGLGTLDEAGTCRLIEGFV